MPRLRQQSLIPEQQCMVMQCGTTAYRLTIDRVIEDLGEDTVDEYLKFCERALVGPANGKRQLLAVTGLTGVQMCWNGSFRCRSEKQYCQRRRVGMSGSNCGRRGCATERRRCCDRERDTHWATGERCRNSMRLL